MKFFAVFTYLMILLSTSHTAMATTTNANILSPAGLKIMECIKAHSIPPTTDQVILAIRKCLGHPQAFTTHPNQDIALLRESLYEVFHDEKTSEKQKALIRQVLEKSAKSQSYAEVNTLVKAQK